MYWESASSERISLLNIASERAVGKQFSPNIFSLFMLNQASNENAGSVIFSDQVSIGWKASKGSLCA